MGLFKKKTKTKTEYVMSIVLRQDEGAGVLMSTNPTTHDVQIVDQRPFKYSNAWENLIYDVDELLFNLEKDHDIELTKALFFVYSHLVDSHSREIKESYFTVLKDISSENKLEALGYVELDEVLAKFLKHKDQSALNAVIVEIDTPAVSVFVYQGGELVFSESVAKTQSITSDLDEIFSHTPKDTILPPRIIMYDSSNLEEESSSILTHKWPKSVFAQIPKVEVVTPEELDQAIIHSYKQQIFHDAESNIIVPPTQTASDELVVKKEQSVDDANEDSKVKEDTGEQTQAAQVETDTNDMGFVVGEDVKKTQPLHKEIPEPTIEQKIEPETAVSNFETQQTFDQSQQNDFEQDRELPRKSFVPSWFSLGNIVSKFRPPAFNIGSPKLGLILIILVALLVVGGGIMSFLYFFHTATLTVLYESAEIKKDIKITDQIAIEKSSETFTVSSSIPTTGNKEIGEKAKGEITIFNADESEKKFEKGTKFLDNNKLAFLLDSDVTIDGAEKTITEDGDILTTTSKKTAQLTAADIGSKYNIADDIKLSIEGFSETTYFARTTQKFTGGTQEEIQTASKSDFETISEQVEEEIEKKSSESINDLNDKKNIITDLTDISISDEKYSKEVAEEADSLDAEVTADVTFYSYDDEEIRNLIIEEIKDDVPDNHNLEKEDISFTIESATKDEDTDDIELELEVTAKPIFKVDTENLIAMIKGKTASSVKNIVKDDFKADGYELSVASQLPFLKSLVPLFNKNIVIEVESL